MTIGFDPADVAAALSPFDALLPALARLDRRLALAVARARVAYGPDAAADRFRGLYIPAAEVDGLLAREPGAGAFFADRADGDDEDDEDDDRDGRGDVVVASRLEWLARAFDLSAFDVDLLVIALAPSLDLRYERIYAYLQDNVTARRPTVDLALMLLCGSSHARAVRRAHFLGEAPLVRHRLLRVANDAGSNGASMLGATIEVDEQIVNLLLGHDVLDRRLSSSCREVATLELDEPAEQAGILAEEMENTLDRLMGDAHRTGERLRLHFHGPEGTGKEETAAALARRAGLSLLRIDLASMPASNTEGSDASALFALALRHAWFQSAVALVVDAAALTDAMRELLAAHPGIVVLCSTSVPLAVQRGRDAIEVPFAHPSVDRRVALWRSALARHAVSAAGGDVAQLARRFRLTPRQIANAAAAAVQGERWRRAEAQERANGSSAAHPAIAADRLFAAARAQCGQELESLALRLHARQRWSDLVLPEDALRQLQEICQRVAGKETVMEHWGFAQRVPRGGGVNAMFTGPSGTGKTMAAEVMAAELGVDLFRVDLAGVVSKYIGETEKNLDRVFAAAEDANGIVFFDEADALFGKRSEVHDSHDRYANIEISYLLQKMEQFDGIAILATNLRGNLDAAFIRRLSFMVHFPFPEAEYRERIWRGIWPAAAPVDPALDMGLLARQFALSGGHIKNIALAAAFLAAQRGDRVEMRDLVQATQREYQKLGKTLTAAELGALGAGDASEVAPTPSRGSRS